MSGRVAKAVKRSSIETNILTVPSSFGPDPPNVQLTPEEQEQAKLGLQWREKEGAYLRLQSREFFSTLFSQLLVRSFPSSMDEPCCSPIFKTFCIPVAESETYFSPPSSQAADPRLRHYRLARRAAGVDLREARVVDAQLSLDG